MALQFNQDEIKDIAYRYMEALKAKFDIKDIYLFGSTVNGAAAGDSDIDIAVISNTFTGDRVQDTFELMRLRRGIDMRLEPHPFLEADFIQANPLAKEIMATGISLLAH